MGKRGGSSSSSSSQAQCCRQRCRTTLHSLMAAAHTAEAGSATLPGLQLPRLAVLPAWLQQQPYCSASADMGAASSMGRGEEPWIGQWVDSTNHIVQTAPPLTAGLAWHFGSRCECTRPPASHPSWPERGWQAAARLHTSPLCVCVCCVLCRRTDGRIPLKDLIRFKERQWFVEELEVRTLLGKGACWVGCTAQQQGLFRRRVPAVEW